MINIGPLIPLVSSPKLRKTPVRDAAVAGSEVRKDSPRLVNKQERRQGDRRKRSLKPLIEMRMGRDRRKSSVDIEV